MTGEDLIALEATVSRFMTNAMTDWFADGKRHTFDAVQLAVSAPPEFRGTTMTIYFPERVQQGSLWQTPNRKIRFSIQRSLLTENRTLFDGAISNLEELAP